MYYKFFWSIVKSKHILRIRFFHSFYSNFLAKKTKKYLLFIPLKHYFYCLFSIFLSNSCADTTIAQSEAQLEEAVVGKVEEEVEDRA